MSQRDSISERTWDLVAVTISLDAEEFAATVLFDLGTTGVVTLEESEDQVKLGGYFAGPLSGDEIANSVRAQFARTGRSRSLLGISTSHLPDQDWMQKWKEGFEQIEIGDKFIIAPSWKPPENSGSRIVIEVDPGMAFGTGSHETTRLCLEAIARYWKGSRLLDVGTGTGILAIAAAKLEPDSRVTAIDVDPVAVEVARENIVINNVTGLVEVFEAQPGDLTGPAFDVVVANLTAEAIVSLMDDLVGRLSQAGVLVLSGILTSLAGEVEARAAEAGLVLIEQAAAGEWCAFVARRYTIQPNG